MFPRAIASLEGTMSGGSTALSTSAPLRYITFAALYAAQGIPEGLTFFAIPAWLAMQGVEAGVVGGYLAIIVLPWSFKLVAGPIMDRFSYLPMGRRRPWVLAGQFGLMLSFLCMTLIPDPVHHIGILSAMGFTVSFFGALQDVATDGMAVDIVPREQQARANGMMWGAKVLGTAASLSTGTWLINNMGFGYAVTALSVAILVIMMVPLFLRERPGEKRFPWGAGAAHKAALAMKAASWGEIFFTLKNAFILRGSLAMVFVGSLFSVGIGYMDALLPIYTIQELGWTNDEYSNVLAMVSTVGAFLAMAVAGWIVDRLGQVRTLNGYIVVMVLLPVLVVATKDLWMEQGYGVWLIASYQTVYTFFMVAYLATAMNLCWKRVAATQFTLFMSTGNMGRAVGAWLLGPMDKAFEWPGMFVGFGVMMALALAGVYHIRLVHHQNALDRLEADHVARMPPDLGGPLVPR